MIGVGTTIFLVRPQTFGGGGGSYLVDDYSPSIALGFRKLSSTSTNAIRVRRSSDNAEQDIGFSGDDLDVSSMETFCGAGDGYIVTLYNQGTTGATHDTTQSTAANQMQIVASGSTLTVNGKAASNLNNTTTVDYTIPLFNGVTNFSYFCVYQIDGASSTAGGFCHPFTRANASRFFALSQNGSTSSAEATFSGGTYYVDSSAITAPTTRDILYDASDNNTQRLLTVLDGTWTVSETYQLHYSTSFRAAGRFQEVVIFDTDENANKSGIESNINTYYSIY